MAIGTDRVQVIKREHSTDGGTDGQGGPFGEPSPINPQQDAIESAGIFVQDATGRDELVGLYRDADELYLYDTANPSGIALSDLGGLSSDSHRALRHLAHFLAGGGPGPGFGDGPYYHESLPSGSIFPTTETWYTTTGKTHKIYELTTTWSTAFPSTEKHEVFGTDGSTVLARATDTITYSGAIETSRTRVVEII